MPATSNEIANKLINHVKRLQADADNHFAQYKECQLCKVSQYLRHL